FFRTDRYQKMGIISHIFHLFFTNLLRIYQHLFYGLSRPVKTREAAEIKGFSKNDICHALSESVKKG
ncbi:MAG: hypothetical protein LUD16_05870, partial [Lachnospiraceae bacterium]|nr:hypothetical protein [Lachnospiraceae bacterium]